MSRTIGMFLMTQKGYFVLKQFLAVFGPEALAFVVSARDEKMCEDYYERIQGLCRGSGVSFYDVKDKPVMRGAYAFAIGWRWMLDHTQRRVVVLHDSLLPKHRGFAPLVSCLIKGERTLGVTALFATEEYDKGDMIAQREVDIAYPVTIQDAIALVQPLYWELVQAITSKILAGETLAAWAQDEAQASYSLWRDEDDYRIDWHQDAGTVERFVDAVGHPYRGASAYIDGKKVRVLQARAVPDVVVENRMPGKVIFLRDGYPVVVCGKGLIQLVDVVDDEQRISLLPLSRFRVRFQ